MVDRRAFIVVPKGNQARRKLGGACRGNLIRIGIGNAQVRIGDASVVAEYVVYPAVKIHAGFGKQGWAECVGVGDGSRDGVTRRVKVRADGRPAKYAASAL